LLFLKLFFFLLLNIFEEKLDGFLKEFFLPDLISSFFFFMNYKLDGFLRELNFRFLLFPYIFTFVFLDVEVYTSQALYFFSLFVEMSGF